MYGLPGRLARVSMCVAASLTIQFAASGALAADAEDPQKAAERLGNQAYEEQAAGKFAEAISTYLKVYDASRAAVTLYNVATIYDRKLHERELASDYYRRYASAPDADPGLVRKATERITALKAEIEAEEVKRRAAVAAAAAKPKTSQDSKTNNQDSGRGSDSKATIKTEPSSMDTVGLVVGGAGVVVLGTGLVFGLLAKNKNDEANSICDGRSCPDQRGVTLAKDAGTFATISTVGVIGGLALVGVGVTLYFTAPKDSATRASLTIAPRVGANGSGMVLQGSF